MIVIDVPCSHGTTKLTIEEAETLLDSLSTNIESAKRRLQKGLTLTDGRYLGRRDLYDFSRQFMPDGAVRNRAGKLFGTVVRTSMPCYHRSTSPLPLRILCGACKLPLGASDTCNVMRRTSGHRYYENDREYLIDTRSLIEYEDQFLPGGTYQLNAKKLEDFKKVMQSIRGE